MEENELNWKLKDKKYSNNDNNNSNNNNNNDNNNSNNNNNDYNNNNNNNSNNNNDDYGESVDISKITLLKIDNLLTGANASRYYPNLLHNYSLAIK